MKMSISLVRKNIRNIEIPVRFLILQIFLLSLIVFLITV